MSLGQYVVQWEGTFGVLISGGYPVCFSVCIGGSQCAVQCTWGAFHILFSVGAFSVLFSGREHSVCWSEAGRGIQCVVQCGGHSVHCLVCMGAFSVCGGHSV